MQNIPSWLESLNIDIDPTAPLSNEDTVRLLMGYCDHRITENNREERTFTKEMLTPVIQSLGDVAKAFRVHADATETKIGDLSLKINSISIYFEEIIKNLKGGLHDIFFQIGSDMRKIITDIKSCKFCAESSSSQAMTDNQGHKTLIHLLPHHLKQNKLKNM